MEIKSPVEYPETGLYHPDLPRKITDKLSEMPFVKNSTGTVGLLLMRSYVLSGDTAHYDEVIRGLEAKGLNVVPAFAAADNVVPELYRAVTSAAVRSSFHTATSSSKP